MMNIRQAGYTTIELLIMLLIPMALAVIAGWITHVVYTIQNSEWIFLIVGALIFPIGMVHGIGLWFGVF